MLKQYFIYIYIWMQLINPFLWAYGRLDMTRVKPGWTLEPRRVGQLDQTPDWSVSSLRVSYRHQSMENALWVYLVRCWQPPSTLTSPAIPSPLPSELPPPSVCELLFSPAATCRLQNSLQYCRLWSSALWEVICRLEKEKSSLCRSGFVLCCSDTALSGVLV